MLKTIVFFSMLLICIEGNVKWHTSQVSLNRLYDLQNDQIAAVKKYLDSETKRLNELNKHLTAIYERWNLRGYKLDTYLHNHINTFTYMTNIYKELSKIYNEMNNNRSIEDLHIIDNNIIPNNVDIFLASKGLRRLQIFYEISASDMVAGTYNGRNIGDEMDACECYVMLKNLMNEHDMYRAVEWANETYNKWKTNGRPNCIERDQLYLYGILLSSLTGFRFFSLNQLNINYESLETKYNSQYNTLMRNEIFELEPTEIIDRYNPMKSHYKSYRNNINLCKSGVSNRTLTVDLECQYNSMGSYYYKLMPFKEEHISYDPHVKIYHDVLNDDEIIKIKSLAIENLHDSEVISRKYTLSSESIRLGQVSDLINETAVSYLNLLKTRVELISKYSSASADYYQVINYGLSGHYVPHFDAVPDYEASYFFKERGNRLATVLFYLNDVPNDGYTSFPNLNVVIPSKKGSALVWYNLHLSNGSKHEGTLHSSCPIIKGNKWIMTKLFHEQGQGLPYFVEKIDKVKNENTKTIANEMNE